MRTTLARAAAGRRCPLLARLHARTPTPAPPAAGDAADPRALTVDSSADACDVSATEAPAGTLTFDVTNTGGQVTEFYLLGEDGLRIVGEVENIGPGLTRDLTVNAPAGHATSPPASRAWSATASAPSSPSPTPTRTSRSPPTSRSWSTQAEANYAAYVEDQTDQLLAKTQEFVELYAAGDDDAARALYAGRAHPLGADRDRGRVVRRPRPEDGRPRGRPRAGSEVDRLAPDREGPVAAARRGLHAADRRRSARRTPTTCWPTPRRSTRGCRS